MRLVSTPVRERLPVSMRRALELAEGSLQSLPAPVVSLNSGHPERAAEEFAAVLPRYERLYGPDSDQVARVLVNQTNALAHTGQQAAALKTARRAAEIRRKVLGPDNPTYAAAVQSLGAMLAESGRLEEGLEHMRIALSTFERANGPNSPEVAASLIGISMALSLLGEHDEAVETSARAVALREALRAAPHEMCGALITHAVNLTGAKRLDEAKRFEDRIADLCPQ